MNIWILILLVGLGAHLVRAVPLLMPRLAEKIPAHLLKTLPLVALACMAATAFVGTNLVGAAWITASLAVAMLVGAKTNLGAGVLSGWAAYIAIQFTVA